MNELTHEDNEAYFNLLMSQEYDGYQEFEDPREDHTLSLCEELQGRYPGFEELE